MCLIIDSPLNSQPNTVIEIMTNGPDNVDNNSWKNSSIIILSGNKQHNISCDDNPKSIYKSLD
jgi:hypothetical protein